MFAAISKYLIACNKTGEFTSFQFNTQMKPHTKQTNEKYKTKNNKRKFQITMSTCSIVDRNQMEIQLQAIKTN